MRNALIIALAIFLLAGIVFNTDNHAFVGTKKCKMCNNGEKKGMIFEKWAEGPHAKAYAVLGEDAAKETYAKLGKTGNPQEDPACLKCHVTGHGMDSTLVAKVKIEDGVSCESCHGAGSLYKCKSKMVAIYLGEADGAALGLLEPDEANCVTCHNEDSPTYRVFDYSVRVKEITHPYPEGYTTPQK